MKERDVIFEHSQPDVAIIANETSHPIGYVTVVYSKLSTVNQFTAYLAFVILLLAHFVILSQSYSVISFQLPVFMGETDFLLVAFIMSFLYGLYEIRIFESPLLHTNALWNLPFIVIVMAGTSLRTESGFIFSGEWFSTSIIGTNPDLGIRLSFDGSPIAHSFLAWRRAVEFFGICIGTLKFRLAAWMGTYFNHTRKIIPQNA